MLENNVLLLGGTGMLGIAYKKILVHRGVLFHSPSSKELDVTCEEAIDRYFETNRPDLVINCTAYTNVERAEDDAMSAYAVNAFGVRYIAKQCKKHNAVLVHHSTDYVFDGGKKTPYNTTDVMHPLNVYGRSKSLGELYINDVGCEHITARTSWLYASWGKNFVKTIIDLTKHKSTLEVVNDQIGKPSNALAVAQRTLALLTKQCRGTFHVTDSGVCSWYTFAEEITNSMGMSCNIIPTKTQHTNYKAKRPLYSVLDDTETVSVVGVAKDWRDNLREVIWEIKNS